MPIEIKELIIRAVVEEGRTTAPNNNGASVIVKKMLKVTKALIKNAKKNER